MAYYAWSRIQHGAKVAKDGVYVGPEFAELGESVTASKLGISEDDFQAMIDGGSVREEKWPVPEGDTRSPREYYLDKAREMEEGATLGTGGSVFAPSTEGQLADVMDEKKDEKK